MTIHAALRLPTPTRDLYPGTKIGRHKQLITIETSFQARSACQGIPDYRKWNPGLKAWVARPSVANIEYLVTVFRGADWSTEAMELVAGAMKIREDAVRLKEERANLDAVEDPEVVDYRWDGVQEPWAHQKRAFLLSRDEESFALLMEQRTGKTKIAIDTGAWWYLHGRLDALFIICPNGVKAVWEEEIEKHLPTYIPREVRVWDSKLGKAATEDLRYWMKEKLPALKVFVMNVEGLSTKRAQEWANDFVTLNRSMMDVDESTRIKTPGAKRTRAIVRLGKKCVARRIMTGTPVTKSPLDLFAQFGFLDTNILGFGSFYAFRNRYALMGGYENRQVLAYTNLDELQETIAPHSFRILERECRDLPPESFQRLEVDLSKQQRRLYDEMAKNMTTEYEGHTISVTLAITQMMRLQQIAGGFVSILNDPETIRADNRDQYRTVAIEGPNPKMIALLDWIEDLDQDQKVIVWSRFRPELHLLEERLAAEYGPDTVAPFHGGVDNTKRTENRLAFQDRSGPRRFFIGNPATGSMGLDLSAAALTAYYSNSFDLEDRLQSQMRTHGPDQKSSCLYLDIVARNTVETKAILPALRDKKNVADLVTGDGWTSWI